jgi:hypothetical protein
LSRPIDEGPKRHASIAKTNFTVAIACGKQMFGERMELYVSELDIILQG